MKTGLELITAERERQISKEGFALEHDDCHTDGSLALVAALYATPQPLFTMSVSDDRKNAEPGYRGLTIEADDPWPCEWEKEWDKREKHGRLRQLTIAGALIAAELDRLQRVDINKGRG